MSVLPVLAWTFTVLLLVLVVVSLLAGRGTIPLNHWAGIRLPPVMRSEATWRAGHTAAVLPAAIAFIVSLGFALAGAAVPIAYWGSIAAFAGGFILVAVRAVRAANATSDRAT